MYKTLKVSLIFLIWGMLSACASFKPVKDTWHSELIGKEFYTKGTPGRSFGGWSNYAIDAKTKKKTDSFNKCEKFKITDISEYGLHLYYKVQQADKEYYIYSHALTSWDKKRTMDQLSNRFPFKNRKVRLKSGNKWSKNLICSGKIWTGMTMEELLFVKGSPYDTNTTTTVYGSTHQLVYGSPPYSSYYYINNKGLLTSWQN